MTESDDNFGEVEPVSAAGRLAALGREFYRFGWAVGTSGNFSAVVRREPLRLLVTASGMDKGALTAEQFVLIDDDGQVLEGRGRPSAEALLHLKIIGLREAGAVLHTHSVWSTILSEEYADRGGVPIEGYEMLKGLAGVTSHGHREWLPIIENSQDYSSLAQEAGDTLERYPDAHGLLLRRHGLYTWGRNIAEARRHVEILEFLLEVIGRAGRAKPHGG
jgi:methylthioribulose-1-phosphate dehydratase